MPGIEFGSKAGTLARLGPVLKSARVLPQVCFTRRQWEQAPDKVWEDLAARGWEAKALMVRSSAHGEDRRQGSQAGHFLSLGNVKGPEAVRGAIGRVAASLGGDASLDEIFVQPFLEAVRMSGVAFSRDPNGGAAYRVINYDETSGTTHSVTSGASQHAKTFYYLKGSPYPPPENLKPVMDLLGELEGLLGEDSLDVEFAVEAGGGLVLLQARPLAGTEPAKPGEEGLHEVVGRIEAKVREMSGPHPYLFGNRAIFGVMPDWNPAEIIGVRPRPLAISLYKEIVTDNIWAYQRDNYGYRNLRSFPLLISFGGVPFIDVRVSFNSFIPADVPAELARRLANAYMERLAEVPAYHDKVEFEIIYSCYSLDLPKRLEELKKKGFSAGDCATLEDCLRRLTNRIIHGETGLWKKDIAKIKMLEDRRKAVLESSLGPVAKIYWLLEDCKRYGTLPFAGLARAGFIAIQMLRSLVEVGILSAEEYHSYLASLETVGYRLGQDRLRLGREEFLRRYGHLRPGTYDILSPRYDEKPDLYFDFSAAPAPGGREAAPFALPLDKLKKTEALLKEHKLEYDVLGFFDFIKGAIEGREYSKFVFSMSLSDSLSLLGQTGREEGFSIEDCSFADIDCVRKLYGSSDSVRETFEKSIREGKRAWALTRRLNLPPLITSPEQVWGFHLPESQPNFITRKTARGPVVFKEAGRDKLKGGILLIPAADPGYDWIFSTGIAGFITLYGGVNSHMAIRAGELGLPAVIGAGEALYNELCRAGLLEIDAANRQVRVLR